MQAPARPTEGEWLPATQAAERLGVSKSTLYSYVSRGLLHPLSGQPARGNVYSGTEVARLLARHASARKPQLVAATSLSFGLPVLESGLCLIEHGRLYYRGQDALALAQRFDLEDVAALLCSLERKSLTGAVPPLSSSARLTLARNSAKGMPRRMLSSFHAVADEWKLTQEPLDPALSTWRCMQAMVVAATGPPSARLHARIHEQLQQAWGLHVSAADLLRRALVLCADHELNASSFTARCVAGTGGFPSAAVLAALAALTGPRHGGHVMHVEASWKETRQWSAKAKGPRSLQMPPKPLGYGHPLYPLGDPRGRWLLEQLPRDRARDRLVAAVRERTGLHPSLDFALVELGRAINAPDGAPFAILAIGRCVGWLAHYFEHLQSGALIRPRASYVGPRPLEPMAVPRGRIIKAQ